MSYGESEQANLNLNDLQILKSHNSNNISISYENSANFLQSQDCNSQNEKIEKQLFQITKVKNFHLCPYKNCKRRFQEKGNLNCHIRTHTKEKPFKCIFDNCGKSFATSTNLKSHLNSHFQNFAYKCQFPDCNMKYQNKLRLDIHHRTHEGIKPYKCFFQNCGKSFNEKGNLKTHMRIHSGERPFICDYEYCRKSFRAAGHLKEHKLIHSENYIGPCLICFKNFTSKNLNLHYKNKHNEYYLRCILPRMQNRKKLRFNNSSFDVKKNISPLIPEESIAFSHKDNSNLQNSISVSESFDSQVAEEIGNANSLVNEPLYLIPLSIKNKPLSLNSGTRTIHKEINSLISRNKLMSRKHRKSEKCFCYKFVKNLRKNIKPYCFDNDIRQIAEDFEINIISSLIFPIKIEIFITILKNFLIKVQTVYKIKNENIENYVARLEFILFLIRSELHEKFCTETDCKMFSANLKKNHPIYNFLYSSLLNLRNNNPVKNSYKRRIFCKVNEDTNKSKNKIKSFIEVDDNLKLNSYKDSSQKKLSDQYKDKTKNTDQILTTNSLNLTDQIITEKIDLTANIATNSNSINKEKIDFLITNFLKPENLDGHFETFLTNVDNMNSAQPSITQAKENTKYSVFIIKSKKQETSNSLISEKTNNTTNLNKAIFFPTENVYLTYTHEMTESDSNSEEECDSDFDLSSFTCHRKIANEKTEEKLGACFYPNDFPQTNKICNNFNFENCSVFSHEQASGNIGNVHLKNYITENNNSIVNFNKNENVTNNSNNINTTNANFNTNNLSTNFNSGNNNIGNSYNNNIFNVNFYNLNNFANNNDFIFDFMDKSPKIPSFNFKRIFSNEEDFNNNHSSDNLLFKLD